jgi:hypothetical protein
VEEIKQATRQEVVAIAEVEIDKIVTNLHKVLNDYYGENVERFGKTVTLLMIGRAVNGMSLSFYGGLIDLHEGVLKKYEDENP